MKKYFIASIALFIFSSCLHKSEAKHEKGVIIEKQYSPAFDGTGVSTGYSTSGHITFGTADIHKDEQFMIVIKCEHGVVFTVNRKDLYATLEKGDSIDISYYEMLNRRNEVKDLDFITATKNN